MAQVTHTTGRKYRKMGLPEDEPPENVTESEGQRLIKDLATKQTNTKINLEQQLSVRQEFTPARDLVSLAQFPAGQVSLEQFAARSQGLELTEDLRSRGWNPEDIQAALDLQQGEDFFLRQHRTLGRDKLQARVLDIKDRLSSRSVQTAEPQQKLSRHEEELLGSVERQSEVSKLLRFAQRCQAPSSTPDNYPADHPMNSLQQLEHQLFSHLRPPQASKPRRKRRRHQQESPNLDSSADERSVETPSHEISMEGGSQWDKRVAPVIPNPARRHPADRTYTCANQAWYAIQEGRPVFLGCKAPPPAPPTPKEEGSVARGASFVAPDSTPLLIPLQEIAKQRLTKEDILKIPKFSSYNEGNPSQTLFVKNLAGGVKETDLVSVFGHFEESALPRLVYRLMGGKMRGQAFVTFPSVSQATRALEALNGFMLRGKPLILQYGKNQ